jgi:hypothetical protein
MYRRRGQSWIRQDSGNPFFDSTLEPIYRVSPQPSTR